MPIRADLRALYPADWKAISTARKVRAGWRCENCAAEHGVAHPETGSRVVLTTAHLDHDPTNNAAGNLAALCQRCHLAYDAAPHRRNAALTRRARMRTLELALKAPPGRRPDAVTAPTMGGTPVEDDDVTRL